MPSSIDSRFAFSQFTTPFQSWEDDIQLMQRLGGCGLELCETKLHANRETAADQLKALHDTGLPVTSVQAKVHAVFPDQMAPEPREPEARMNELVRTMDRIAIGLPGASPAFVLISGRAPDHDLARARETLAEQAARLAEEAAPRGCRIAFEPLNPVMMNEDSFVCSWDDAVTLAEYVARDNFGLVCDLWNVWQESDIYASVAGSAAHLALVHVSDWRDGGPRRLNDRLVPGHGVIPLERWGALLRQVGYEGWVCLEMLSDRELEDSFYHRPVAEVVEESRSTMQAARLC